MDSQNMNSDYGIKDSQKEVGNRKMGNFGLKSFKYLAKTQGEAKTLDEIEQVLDDYVADSLEEPDGTVMLQRVGPSATILDVALATHYVRLHLKEDRGSIEEGLQDLVTKYREHAGIMGAVPYVVGLSEEQIGYALGLINEVK